MQKDIHTRGVNKYWFILPIFSFFLILIDNRLKNHAIEHFPKEDVIKNPEIFELILHKNFGIAFNIPFSQSFIIASSLIIGGFLIWTAIDEWSKRPGLAVSSTIILIGGAGNFYDRITYGFTVDYLLILGRSIINISDIVIVSGVILLLMTARGREH